MDECFLPWLFGVEGFVVSDRGAVHSTQPAADSGLDLEIPGPPRFSGDALVSAVREGRVSEDLINDSVRRILRVVTRASAFRQQGSYGKTRLSEPGGTPSAPRMMTS